MDKTQIEELYRFKDRTDYLKALDSVILKKDIQEREIGSGKVHRYLPVAIKEAIADYVFHYWNVIDEKFNKIDGMLVCTIKLTYTPSYPGADELYCTGSAAVLVQDKKNALEYQLPAVKSEAVGNALASIGNIFGRNLARKLNKDTNIPDEFTLRKYDEPIKQGEPVKKSEPVKANEPFKKQIIETPF